MASVLHFSPDGDNAACGAKTFLCDEITDERRYVDCKRCQRTKAFINYDPRRFNVDVWNYEGDVIDWAKDVRIDGVESMQETYEDDPTVSVVVEELPC